MFRMFRPLPFEVLVQQAMLEDTLDMLQQNFDAFELISKRLDDDLARFDTNPEH